MSEILRHEPTHEKPLATVIPLQREAEEDESIDFTELSSSEVTEFFIKMLNHPGYKDKHGMALAETLDRDLNAEPDDPQPFRQRLKELLGEADASYYDDTVYDHKAEHDEVFQELIKAMQLSKNQKGLELHRRMGLRMLELRSMIADSTDCDEQWLDVCRRLFSSQ